MSKNRLFGTFLKQSPAPEHFSP